jgi:modification methylase
MADPHLAHVAPAAAPGGCVSQAGCAAPPAPLLSVILTGQRSLAVQRRGRYVTGSGAHPARMAPDLAAALIRDYTAPGELVFDPLAGVGTTLVEAIHAGRNGLGMEYEPGWVALAHANIDLARRHGGAGHGRILRGDATRLPRGVPGELRGQISLVLTSPPYGRTMHGRVEHRRGPLTRFHNAYSHRTPGAADPQAANLAHRGRAALIDGITAVLAGCIPLLKPGGLIVVVARPWRRDHFLVDLPGQTIQAGLAAGLHLLACRRAVHAAVRDGRLVPRHTFWQLSVARASRRKGMPVHLIQHDDIAVFAPDPPRPGPDGGRHP